MTECRSPIHYDEDDFGRASKGLRYVFERLTSKFTNN